MGRVEGGVGEKSGIGNVYAARVEAGRWRRREEEEGEQEGEGEEGVWGLRQAGGEGIVKTVSLDQYAE